MRNLTQGLMMVVLLCGVGLCVFLNAWYRYDQRRGTLVLLSAAHQRKKAASVSVLHWLRTFMGDARLRVNGTRRYLVAADIHLKHRPTLFEKTNSATRAGITRQQPCGVDANAAFRLR